MKPTMQFIFAVTFVILACSVADAKVKTKAPKNCTIEPKEGPCRALLPRYFFNITSKQCEHFNYGGCEGNTNRFVSKTRCQKVCKVTCNTCGYVRRLQQIRIQGRCSETVAREILEAFFMKKMWNGMCQSHVNCASWK